MLNFLMFNSADMESFVSLLGITDCCSLCRMFDSILFAYSLSNNVGSLLFLLLFLKHRCCIQACLMMVACQRTGSPYCCWLASCFWNNLCLCIFGKLLSYCRNFWRTQMFPSNYSWGDFKFKLLWLTSAWWHYAHKSISKLMLFLSPPLLPPCLWFTISQ